jgi:lysophospholipase L1-like esterase
MRVTSIYKVVLGPMLLLQGRRLRRSALRLPEAAGERSGFIIAEDSKPLVKLLFVGDSTMAGVGVRHQSAALAAQVASRLAGRLGRSASWQMVAKSGLNARQALEFVSRHEILPADVLITALGTNDVLSQTEPRQFIEDYKALVNAIAAQAGARLGVVSGLPPLHLTPATPQPLRWYLGKCAHVLDVNLRRWVVPQQNLTYVSLQWASNRSDMAEDGFHPGANLYKAWANLLSESIDSLLSRQDSKEADESLAYDL